MIDFPTMPDFLNRKTNGLTTAPVREARKRAPRAKKLPADAVRRYVANRSRGLACGWNAVQVVKRGRKWVTVRPVGKTRCIKFTVSVFERIWDKAP
jgi:hypothetical protein